jgi:NTP pyrophosphatase (non-canonical NTP hydrolase)
MDEESIFEQLFNEFMEACHQNSVDHGFWEEKRNKGEMIALMHSELSELLESVRKPKLEGHLSPEFSLEEEELADELIRVFDYAAGFKLNLFGALMAKFEYNRGRPYKHGKEF